MCSKPYTQPGKQVLKLSLIDQEQEAARKMTPFSASLLRAPFVALILATVASTTQAETLETLAKQAIIIDYNTGTILLEKKADERMAPSSMSKLMTAYMVFQRLKEGSWKLTDELPVSESAWKRHYKSGGSLMFLKIGTTASIESLIHGVIIQSGNDACSVLAEAYAGSEEAFAAKATHLAQQMGMTNTTLRNASGWPDPEHLTTARDLSILATRLINDFPEYFPIYSKREFTHNGIKQGNRNPLLYSVAGADGLKTGHTESAGYGLVGTVKRNDRRVIMVINGLKNLKERAEESERLIEWAFREFEDYALFKPDETVVEAEVWLGVSETVPLVAAKKLEVTLPRKLRPNMKVTAVYSGPIPAPIKRGQQVATLVITAPGIQTVELPLVAGADVEKVGFFGRIGATVKYFFKGGKAA